MIGIAAFSITFFISGASCQTAGLSPSPSPPAPTPEKEPAPASESTPPAGWSADGIISPGEYTAVNRYNNFEIHWASDEQNIYIGMRARTGGWLALGIQPGSRMRDADMIFGFVKDGVITVFDLFSTGDFGPHPPDTELGGTDDILESGGSEEGGYTVIEIKRELTTGDKYDHPLAGGVNKIIWAYGSADELTLKHTQRGYGELNL